MCTVTVIRIDDLIRVACNRDEQRTRLAAVGPSVHSCGDALAIYPVDVPARGTWIGVNDSGLTLALVNLNSDTGRINASAKSRGLIIPGMLHCRTAADAMAAVRCLDLSETNPFRLLAVDGRETIEFRHTGVSQSTLVHSAAPVMVTSSGLGDRIVEGARRKCFEQMFANVTPTARLQDLFHRQSSSDQPHVSVCMRRPDARTVSFTVVEVTPENSTMSYLPDAPDSDATAQILRLRHRKMSVA